MKRIIGIATILLLMVLFFVGEFIYKKESNQQAESQIQSEDLQQDNITNITNANAPFFIQ